MRHGGDITGDFVEDRAQLLAAELRLLLARRVHDPVLALEMPVLHASRLAFAGDDGSQSFAVLGLQPMLDAALARLAQAEAKQCLTLLLGSSDLRFRSLKERGTMAARVLGVKYDAYRRKHTGHLYGHLLILATEILADETSTQNRRSSGPVEGSGDVAAGNTDLVEDVAGLAQVGSEPHADGYEHSADGHECSADGVDAVASRAGLDASSTRQSEHVPDVLLDGTDTEPDGAGLVEDDSQASQARDNSGALATDRAPDRADLGVTNRCEPLGELIPPDLAPTASEPGAKGSSVDTIASGQGVGPFKASRAGLQALVVVVAILVVVGVGAWRSASSDAEPVNSDPTGGALAEGSGEDTTEAGDGSGATDELSSRSQSAAQSAAQSATAQPSGAGPLDDDVAGPKADEAVIQFVQASLVTGQPDPAFVPVDQACLEAGALGRVGEAGVTAPDSTHADADNTDADNTDLASAAVDELAAAADAMAVLVAELPVGACMNHVVAEREGTFWQEFSVDRRLQGGLIAWRPALDQPMTAVLLPLGLWQSYLRIAGSDGSGSPAMAGFPTGDIVELADDHFQLEVLGDVALVSEDPVGTFYWMPGVVASKWNEVELTDRPLGWPTSSVYLHNGQYQVDFTNGYLRQSLSGGIDAFYVTDPGLGLLPAGELRGRLITSLDGTAWLVDDDLRRWWVPDGQAWTCLGAGDNLAQHNLFGYEIHALEYGGVAHCPMSSGPTAASGGGLDLSLYCFDEVGADTRVELFDDGWVCDRATGAEPIDKQAACDWQYGVGARPMDDEADSRHFRCVSA